MKFEIRIKGVPPEVLWQVWTSGATKDFLGSGTASFEGEARAEAQRFCNRYINEIYEYET